MPSTQWVLRPSFLLRCEPLSHGGRMVISSSSVSLPTFSFPPDGSAFSCVFDGALCPAWCTLSSPVYKNSVFLLRPAWAPLSFCWQTSAYNRFSFSHWYLTLCGLVLPIDVSAESSSRAKIYVWSISVSLIPAHCKDHSRCLLSICWMIKKKTKLRPPRAVTFIYGVWPGQGDQQEEQDSGGPLRWGRSVYRASPPGAGPGPRGLRSSSWARGPLMSYWLANSLVAIWRCCLTPCWLACPRHKPSASPGVWVWRWDACFCLLRVPVASCLHWTQFSAWPLDEWFSVLEEFDREARENEG